MIDLPKDWKTYHNSIRDRSKDLIELGIWSGIDHSRLESWRKNFRSDEEKYLSACLLDSLIYRSNKQTYSLIQELLYHNLPNYLYFNKLSNSSISEFPYCLQNSKEPFIRLVSVRKETDPGTKSSYEILRFMKRFYSIREDWIIDPSKINDAIKSGVCLFIFIDDFLGSGDQIIEVLESIKIKELLNGKIKVIYAPLIAHKYGIDQVNMNYPGVDICNVEYLNEDKHCFFKKHFKDQNEQIKAREFYSNFLRGYKFKGNPFGYCELEIILSFEHACPDNSLPILHFKDINSTFKSLFDR